MRVSALNVNSMHCPALREGRAPIPRPGCQEAVGCEEVSNQGQVFEAHEQGGNRRAIACVISGIEGRKQVRAAAPALLGESSEKTCRSLAGGPTLRLPRRSYNQMKCWFSSIARSRIPPARSMLLFCRFVRPILYTIHGWNEAHARIDVQKSVLLCTIPLASGLNPNPSSIPQSEPWTLNPRLLNPNPALSHLANEGHARSLAAIYGYIIGDR